MFSRWLKRPIPEGYREVSPDDLADELDELIANFAAVEDETQRRMQDLIRSCRRNGFTVQGYTLTLVYILFRVGREREALKELSRITARAIPPSAVPAREAR